MTVKVPPLLHKMSMTAQKAWYKKHGMEMPTGAEGKSAAQAKMDVGEINKKKAREAAIAAAAAKPKNKELVSSSERVRKMAALAKAFGGQRPGGDLTTASGIVQHIRSGGTLRAGRLGEENIQEGNPATKEKVKNYVRGLGVKATIKGLVPFDQIHSPLRSGRKVLRTKTTAELKKEEVELDEVTKKEAEAVLGGEVKEKPQMAPGKQPAGYRYVRGLARKAMKKGMKDEFDSPARKAMERELQYNPKYRMEEVELVEQDDTMEKKEMAQTQLHFIGYAAKEILEFIDMGGEIEEWYQNKLSKVQSEVESLHSYIEGEKRRTGMVKEETEEVEQVDEKYMGFKKLKASIAAKGDVRNPAAVAAAIGRKKYGKEKFQAMAAAGKRAANEEVEQIDELDRKTRVSYLKKSLTQLNNIASSRHTSGNKNYGSKEVEKRLAGLSRLERSGGHSASVRDNIDKARARFEEVEHVTEAEGSVPTTPKEKELAKHHGDPNKITYGDVIKARIKSAAAKKMGK